MFRADVLAMGFGVFLAAAREPGAAQSPAPARTEADSESTLVQIGSGVGPVTSIANAGDSRLFLTLRNGRIVIWDGNGVLPRAFLDISRLVSSAGARGLFSIAFHPKYGSNGFFFLSYTDASGNLAIARYKRLATNANRADSKSGVVLLTIPIPANADHSGGELQFGPDGYLYVGVGDGGSGEDPPCNAQRDDVLLGKILRLDVSRKAAARPPFYRIPKSNPFARAGPPLDVVWAKGLRYPRRFSFDRLTGDLYIGDVGQTAREEIDFQARASRGGENYGWGVMEGSLCAAGGSSGCPAGFSPCNSPDLRLPILEYGHESGDCAVVGGLVYRGSRIPGLSGVYFYGDSCTGHIWEGDRPLDAVATGVSTFGEDSTGELYVGTEAGALYQIAVWQPALTATILERGDSESAPEAPIPLPFEIFPPILPSPSGAAATGPIQWSEPQLPPPPAEFPQLEEVAPPPPDTPVPPQEPPPTAPPPPAATPPPAAPPPPERMPPAPPPRDLPPPRTVAPH